MVRHALNLVIGFHWACPDPRDYAAEAEFSASAGRSCLGPSRVSEVSVDTTIQKPQE